MVQLPFLIFADMKQAESQEDDVSIEGMRILLAEDNELNMEIAEFLLTNAGEDKSKALKAGMDEYLTKPLESEKLIRALSRYKYN